MKKVLSLLCGLALLSGCIAPFQVEGDVNGDVEAGIPLDVCYSSVSATQSVAMYALENGIYDKYGLDVNLVFIEGGSIATSALIAGEMDICQIAGSALVNGIVAGAELSLIAGLFNTYVYSLMVTPDITSAEDLKGKAVAIGSVGGAADTAIRLVLQSLGLQPDDDVAILATGGQGKRLAAMESGAIAGTVVSVPQTAMARQFGYRELVNMMELNAPFQHTALTTSRQFLDEDPEVVSLFLQATIDAIAQMKQDREGVINVLAQYLLLDPVEDAQVLEEAFDVLILDYLPDMPFPTIEGVQVLLDALEVENAAAAEYDAADIIDTKLLEEIEKSSFRENLQ